MAMPKAYWIVHIEVHDMAAYALYRSAVSAPLAAFGGKFLVRAGVQLVEEGSFRPRSVVIEFPDMAAASGCYNSEAYQAVKGLRSACATADLAIVEGWDG
jgi:uncharacterized protein (DUF1330 family)